MGLLREVAYVNVLPRNIQFVLAGDIGGTNSNFGVCQIEKNKINLLLSIHIKSKEITDFPLIVNQVIHHLKSNYEIHISRACFAAAGVVSEDNLYSKPTNLPFIIDAREIIARTDLEYAIIINDFEAVGYGVDYISPESLITINEGSSYDHANRAIIGAGTGLGKGVLGWNDYSKKYIPIPSEGGHADFPVYTQQEFDLMSFIKNNIDPNFPVSWENVLSGGGIIRLYNYLGTKNQYQETEYTRKIKESGANPDQIFKYWQEDQRSAETYNCYSRFYARCAKNFALESLALNGLYIAGGIAAKNLPLFQRPEFMAEFINCKKQQGVLENIPVKVIADYNVSLFGAAAFLKR
ncbi:MAG: glucokinase [Candidatus Babeliales bacterium]